MIHVRTGTVCDQPDVILILYCIINLTGCIVVCDINMSSGDSTGILSRISYLVL